VSEELYGAGIEIDCVDGVVVVSIDATGDCDATRRVEPKDALDFAIRLLEMIRCSYRCIDVN